MKKRVRFILRQAALLLMILVLCASCAPAKQAVSDYVEKEHRPGVPEGPFVVANSTVGVTGDILVHTPLITSAARIDYDFSENYTHITDYYSRYDLMIANLEVTLGGTEAGAYVGYPTFNCPDTVIDALQGAGVDMVLTANNHTYDTFYHGLTRTQQVLKEKGMAYTGTRLSETDKNYIMRDVDGISLGMACYTYETEKTSDGRKTLNGIPLKAEACPLVNSFNYSDLESFYREVETTLAAMKAEGADATMLFIHWGEEYQLKPNKKQKTIAARLNELGVDVIVGGHPHVLQPMEVLTAENGHKTYCVYSVGNAVSNQRRDRISSAPNGHTEDGMVFEITFQKWSDGRVEVSAMDILPTWVNMEYEGGRRVYTIIPLDTEAKDLSVFGVNSLRSLTSSYDRIMDVVGEGLNACRETLGIKEVPAALIAE